MDRGGHRNGSACDIINHGELPSAWISGISVSQTETAWRKAERSRGKLLSERAIGPRADERRAKENES